MGCGGTRSYQLLARPQGFDAFTRLELVVTITVLAVLTAVAFKSVAHLRERQQLAICTANLMQIDRAVLLYAKEHGDRLPDSVSAGQGDLWWWYKEKVKGYAGLTGASSVNDRVFACPGDRGYSDPRPFCKTARFDYSSYVFNGVQLLGAPNIAGWQVPSIQDPQRTLLVMEWSAHAPLSWHHSRTGKANAPFYCDAESVLGFVDGHVRFSRIYYDGYTPAFTRDPIPGYDYKYSGKQSD
jgi:type II secretory pathway pseudopilin PulG